MGRNVIRRDAKEDDDRDHCEMDPLQTDRARHLPASQIAGLPAERLPERGSLRMPRVRGVDMPEKVLRLHGTPQIGHA
jgi:hypothetical protein